MLQNNTAMRDNGALESNALALGKLLDEHHGGDVVVMDMRSLNFWTDFFILGTVTSTTHQAGLERHIKDYARQEGLEILRRSRRPETGSAQDSAGLSSDEWCLLDLGSIVIHLMSARTRSFFELERLWSAAPLIYQSDSFKNKTSQTGLTR